jgi:hypothetical protein
VAPGSASIRTRDWRCGPSRSAIEMPWTACAPGWIATAGLICQVPCSISSSDVALRIGADDTRPGEWRSGSAGVLLGQRRKVAVAGGSATGLVDPENASQVGEPNVGGR